VSGPPPLPWQEAPWRRVTEAAGAGRLAHALLLAGPRGVGKGQFAASFGGHLLCEARGAVGPCGECRSCVQIAAGVHPNLLRLAPAEDRRDIAIDDIRALIERLHLSSHYGQSKVAIIEPADRLNDAGQNALLKTVEEPPPATHLLLVSERWRALSPTLRSRCQILRFAVPPAATALAWLRAQHPGEPEAVLQAHVRAPLAAAIGEGEGAEQWARALRELREGRFEALKLAQGLKRESAQAALESCLAIATAWLRDALVAGAGQPPPPGVSVPALQRLLADIVEALPTLDRAQPTLAVESIMIRWASADR
jgi:DNA polymerase III subunit delta'